MMILIIPIWVAMMILILVGAYKCYKKNTEDDDEGNTDSDET